MVYWLSIRKNQKEGVRIKLKVRHILIGLAVIFILGFSFCIINSFTGNPISSWIASRKITEYVAAEYPKLDLTLSKVHYNFINSAYGCQAQSRISEDTVFYIGYSGGKVSDDYEYEVANHFTTYRRQSKAFNDLVQGIVEKAYPQRTSMVLGDLLGDTKLLKQDSALDLNNMPLKLSLTVSLLSEVRTDKQMATSLFELHQLMLSHGITIDSYSLILEEPVPEESKPGSGDNLYLRDFPAENVTDNAEVLASVIRKHRLDMEQNDKK